MIQLKKETLNHEYIMNHVINVQKNFRKLKDYNYFTGKCRGAAHFICNLRYAVPIAI